MPYFRLNTFFNFDGNQSARFFVFGSTNVYCDSHMMMMMNMPNKTLYWFIQWMGFNKLKTLGYIINT